MGGRGGDWGCVFAFFFASSFSSTSSSHPLPCPGTSLYRLRTDPPARWKQITPQSTSLLITEPVFNLPNVQDHHDQIVFEEYEFASYLRAPGTPPFPPPLLLSAVFAFSSLIPVFAGPALIPYGPDCRPSPMTPVPECVLVVDAGFSFTHVVPVLRGAIVSKGVRRFVPFIASVLCRSF